MTLTAALVVEDDPASAARMRRLLGEGMPGVVVHHAPTIAAAEALLQTTPFRLALVDMHLPDGLGVDLIGRMQRQHPALQAVIVSAFGSEDMVIAAVMAGATGYLLKDADDAELLSALRSIERGGAPMDPVVARKILEMAAGRMQPAPAPAAAAAAPPSRDARAAVPAVQLTAREQQVLELIAQGWTNREIAETAHLSTHTVESHAKSIYRKLAVSSRTQAVHQARRSGLLG